MDEILVGLTIIERMLMSKLFCNIKNVSIVDQINSSSSNILLGNIDIVTGQTEIMQEK